MCMLGKCGECVELRVLRVHLQDALGNETRNLKYKNWIVREGRCEYFFVETLSREIMATILDMVATKNREHYFVKAVQQDYMTRLRDTLKESAL